MMKKQADVVTFTPELRDELVALYDKAVKDGKDTFTYRAREYSVQYTYYLLQHLDNVFGKKGEADMTPHAITEANRRRRIAKDLARQARAQRKREQRRAAHEIALLTTSN